MGKKESEVNGIDQIFNEIIEENFLKLRKNMSYKHTEHQKYTRPEKNPHKQS